MAQLAFKKAVKHESKLRCALVGPPGAGKTYGALSISKALLEQMGNGDSGIAVIDTEHGSAAKYADLFDFDTLELTSFSPIRYIEAIKAAEAAGYAVLIIDSLSHAWNGVGGVLELVDRKGANNKFNAWKMLHPSRTS
jgi:hypothetical protein